MRRLLRRRTVLPAGLTAFGGSALALAINYATDDANAWWAWILVVAITVAQFGFLLRHEASNSSGTAGHDQVDRIPSLDFHEITGDVTVINRSANESPTMAVIYCLGLILALVAGLVVVATPHRTATPPEAAPPSAEDGDVVIQDIWPSSRANRRRSVPDDCWVATDFAVGVPYIRAVEVAAMYDSGGTATRTVLLRIVDEAGNEIDSGEATIEDYRAKVTFSHPVDVRQYSGKYLYLQLVNKTGEPLVVYVSTDDRNPSVAVYGSCGINDPPRQHADAGSYDLSARLVGRYLPSPWPPNG